MADIIVPVVLFLTIGLSIYFYLRARTKERLACIEKGMDVMPRRPQQIDTRRTVLTIGLFMIGIGIGLLLAYILNLQFGFENSAALPSMVLLFGGLSLVISNFIKFKKEE